MSCNGPGQCCGQDKNIFAIFQHSFNGQKPLNTSFENYPWAPELVPFDNYPPYAALLFFEAEACQDRYLRVEWTTEYNHSVNGVRTREIVWEKNPYDNSDFVATETNTGDDTEYVADLYEFDSWSYVNPANHLVREWWGDEDHEGDNPEITTATATHLVCTHYYQHYLDSAVKLVVSTDFELSISNTHASFLARCNSLYDGVNFGRLNSDAPGSGGGTGWVVISYGYDSTGTIVNAPYDWPIELDSFFSVAATYFSAQKSIRLPGVTMYESGGTTFGVNIENPIDPEGDYKFLTDTYPYSCSESWPVGETPTSTCVVLVMGSSFEVSANDYSFNYIAEGSCP